MRQRLVAAYYEAVSSNLTPQVSATERRLQRTASRLISTILGQCTRARLAERRPIQFPRCGRKTCEARHRLLDPRAPRYRDLQRWSVRRRAKSDSYAFTNALPRREARQTISIPREGHLRTCAAKRKKKGTRYLLLKKGKGDRREESKSLGQGGRSSGHAVGLGKKTDQPSLPTRRWLRKTFRVLLRRKTEAGG